MYNMLGTQFCDTQSRNVVAHSLVWCPDLNAELVMAHRDRESAVNLVYPRSTVKVCIENSAEEIQPVASSRKDKPALQRKQQQAKDVRNNIYDAPQPSSSISKSTSSIITKAKRAKALFFESSRVKQYIDLIGMALSISSVSSLRGMTVTLHKLIMLLREKMNELDNDELDREWSIPWNSFDGCTITIRMSLVRTCNLLCLRLFYPRCHDAAVLAKFYQIKPLMIYTPISSWLDCAFQTSQLPLPFQMQRRWNEPNLPVSQIYWSRDDLTLIKTICNARYFYTGKIHEEVICGVPNAFMSRQLLNTHRYLKTGSPRLINFVGEVLLNYNDEDFVEEGEVIELSPEAVPKKLLNAERFSDVPSCYRTGGTKSPIKMYCAATENSLAQATVVTEAEWGNSAKGTPSAEQFKLSYIYVTHEDRKVDNTRFHALNAFIKHRRMSHISIKNNSWRQNPCFNCGDEIFSSEPILVCDQCCQPIHQKCAPILNKAPKTKFIHHGDVKYTYMCQTCTRRNTWLNTAIRPQLTQNSARDEMLVLHPRTLVDTCLIGVSSLMAASPDTLEFPLTQVWGYIKEHWHGLKPIAGFRNMNEENDEAENEKDCDTMALDGDELSDADLAEIHSYRASFKALLVTHPAFEVDLQLNKVSFSVCMLISMIN